MELGPVDFFKQLVQRRPDVQLRGPLTIRLRGSRSGEPAVIHIHSNDEGLQVVTDRAPVGDELTIDIAWVDLRRLLQAEVTLHELGSDGLVAIEGDPAAAVSAVHALSTVDPSTFDPMLPPVHSVRVTQSFDVSPFADGDPFSLPIIINAFNRVSFLRSLVEALRRRGYENLYVIDNASSYAPLLDYYRTSGLRVFHLDKNVGCYALWRTSIEKLFSSNYYAYTDPDVVPSDGCPADFAAFFLKVLAQHPDVAKVGFGLELDLPEHYPLRAAVLEDEERFWANPIGEGLYDAAVDTTFAVYRPGARGGFWVPAIRTGGAYVARHLPWYEDPTRRSDEELYYLKTSSRPTVWTARSAQALSLESAERK